jgi:predicted nuclease of restriction endonuclease-like (RecB) superfamily
MSELIPTDYPAFLDGLKDRIRTARIKAALAVNRELVLLYWSIGRDILVRQQEQGWGGKVVDRLSSDLRREFPEMKGLSVRNLKYMRTFAESWSDETIVQEALAQITWDHNIALLEKLSTSEERLWYLRKTIEHGWSRNILTIQIETKLYERQGKAVTNFTRSLPAPQSDLAQETLKDPYKFDFLSLGDEAHERDIENALINHIRRFLLELGAGFAFLGNQYHLDVADQDFYLDLLFYHVKLRGYVVIDLKATEFKPEYAGKMNFYLSVVDDLLRHPDDKPSIGLILCKTQNRVVAEYALRDVNKPIGLSLYDLGKALPSDIKGSLPTIEEIEGELAGEAADEG